MTPTPWDGCEYRSVRKESPSKSTVPTCSNGGCTCRFVRYRMTARPLFVHCCHCRWCQRETGASFALNALIEADRVQLLQGKTEVIDTPSPCRARPPR